MSESFSELCPVLFQVVAEELEVEPLTYCVKYEPEDEDDDDNSNFMDSDCGSDDNGEQNLVTNVDPAASVLEEDDSEEEQSPTQPMIDRRHDFEPAWMNNGNEESENGDVGQGTQWICQYCNSNFPNEEKFQRHALIHTSVIVTFYIAQFRMIF